MTTRGGKETPGFSKRMDGILTPRRCLVFSRRTENADENGNHLTPKEYHDNDSSVVSLVIGIVLLVYGFISGIS